MALHPTRHIRIQRDNNTRIGPVSVITLIAVICMAVMAALAISTAQATYAIAQRQADATTRLYQNELAGQEFVAGVDQALASVRAAGGGAAAGARAVDQALDGICADARAAGGEGITCTARLSGTTVTAEFASHDTRLLNVAVTIRDDATYEISEWKTTAAPQEPQPGGMLWTGM